MTEAYITLKQDLDWAEQEQQLVFELRNLLETAWMSGRMYIDDRKWGERYITGKQVTGGL